MFVWGGEKCESTHICHPLNKKRPLVLKNLDKAFQEISQRFRELTFCNILLIDDCPYKCMGNIPYYCVLPHCHNPNFGLMTKGRACKGSGQEGSLGVTSHTPRNVGECEGMNPHTPK